MQAYDLDFQGLTVLECGSHEGGDETRNFRQKNNCYYIDAVLEHSNAMKRNPTVKPENVLYCALTDYDGQTTFTLTSHPGNSSVKHSKEHREELETIFHASFHDIVVPCVCYKTLQDHVIKKIIDILILDIEGGELVVLQHMKTMPVFELPKILCIEAGYDWLERKKVLLELGYILDYYDFNNVVLHHSTFQVKKHEEFIRQMNFNNKEFIWQGKTVYVNDCI